MAYSSITVEGGLFPGDLLERIAAGDAKGQREVDFSLDGIRLSTEMQGAFADIRSFWDAFQRRLAHSHESRTTITRDTWMRLVLERLGYDTLEYQRSAIQIGRETYVISHRAGRDEEAPPVHIAGIDIPLDRKAEGARRSLHATVQEYLNGSDSLWGIVTNGLRLRLLRDSKLVARPTYLEFNLQAMVEGNLYSEFVLLYRLLHRTRLPGDGEDPATCLLETYYLQGEEEGSRVREHLREGVEEALCELGTAFLAHPRSAELREALRSGALDARTYYRELLSLVYRLLFLLVVEERKLLFPAQSANAHRQQIYSEYYSASALRNRADRPLREDGQYDLWEGLKRTFRLFAEDATARQLGLAALNGYLFGSNACRHIEGASCSNALLLRAVFRLSRFGADRRRINYAGLDVEELGSVYESLLDFHPRVDLEPAPRFDLIPGSERKQTGSYYTPRQLVAELIQSALVPVIEERLKGTRSPTEAEKALLDLRVCDPASGSGHFLLAAARRIAQELARVRTGEGEPPQESYREAVRDVIRTCIYAVDKNPLAVDLCKVALWIEGYNAGTPLSFLDSHIKNGDSLVGVCDKKSGDSPAGMGDGRTLPIIPEGAYAPVSEDDRAFASQLKKLNKQEGYQRVTGESRMADLEEIAGEVRRLGLAEERTAYDVREKARRYDRLYESGALYDLARACDLWTAAFFFPLRRSASRADEVPTTGTIASYKANPRAANAQQVGRAVQLAAESHFFHWHIEFPDVMNSGGFDVILGNPPWERIKLQEEEFFAARDGEIAHAPNKAARDRLITTLPQRNPALAEEFARARHDAEAASKFIRGSGRFPLCGRGDVNTYSIFAELNRSLLRPGGRAGCIVPSGIATDDTTKYFFGDLMEKRSLVSLYDFENREKIFASVDSRMKFCLLTMTASSGSATAEAEFAFFLTNTEQLRNDERRFALTADDMALLNPNTRTCPIFRSRRDAEITKAIYRQVPVLIKEEPPEENPWGISFLRMFDMSNDSHLFRTRDELEAEELRLDGNVFTGEGERYLPLYEGKMFQAFDHRAASVTVLAHNINRAGQPLSTTPDQHADPHFSPEPQYWVRTADVEAKLGDRWRPDWILSFKDVTSVTNERTVIACVLPRTGVGHTAPIVMPRLATATSSAALLAVLNSFVTDYVARQKVGGLHLTYGYVSQFAVMDPARLNARVQWTPTQCLDRWLAARVAELTYTAYDLRSFAIDLGYNGPPFPWDPERRFLLRCELDAAFFHLYGIERDDVQYIMETFPIVKRKDEAKWGEYRTKRVILEMYDAMSRAMATGVPYQGIVPDDRQSGLVSAGS